jgi:molecular chaperone DnaK (HSP70)
MKAGFVLSKIPVRLTFANPVAIFSDAVLEVVFEVDVNGILKVTATEKTSGRSANITISNSVGKLSSSEIESMINGQ